MRQATRDRVLDVARDLGYTPSRVARSLSTGRTHSLGLVVPDISNPFFAPMIKAVQPVPGAEAGAAAVRLLVRLMAEGVPGPAPRQQLATELIVRATTGATSPGGRRQPASVDTGDRRRRSRSSVDPAPWT